MKLYKVLNYNGTAIFGTGSWHLPNGTAGEWMTPIEGELKACERGYHLCRRKDLIDWLGSRVFEAEHDGELLASDNKVVVRHARLIREMNWNDKTSRLFACDCAEHVLHIYEKHYPDDSRARNCIEVTRKVANDDLPVSELAAAGDAAWTAAKDAAWAAAKAAAWAAAGAAAKAAARDAAWAAARDAAGTAARDAAGTAARDAERKWQTARLFEYLEGAS